MHLVIIDLNGVLCIKNPGGRPALLRPYVKAFLKQLLDWQEQGLMRFAIWSTITEKNASIIVNQLLTPEEQSKCLFIWFANKCSPHPEIPFKSYKDLENAWKEFPQFSASNTTIFDDSPFKVFKQPNNSYLVNTYVRNAINDNELLRLQEFIQTSLLPHTLPGCEKEETKADTNDIV